MAETDTIKDSDQLVTVASLAKDLLALEIPQTGALLVHSSLSSLGWVSGGAQAVLEALIQSVGRDGTLVLPAHSSNRSDPAN